jgi:hypothetical protein
MPLGVLEYWSNGVMGKARFAEFLGGRNQGENLKVQRFFFKTNTPTLQYSSTPADYYWQSHWSLTGPEEPGFTYQNENWR